jgi:hypothetical protein
MSSPASYVNKKVLDMAQDFPAQKYDYKLKPEMRMFGEVIVHIASGNIYAAKAGMGEKVKWDDQEPDPAKYATRPACVALLKKSIEDANAALKANPKGPRRTCSLFCRCCSAVPNTMVCWSRTRIAGHGGITIDPALDHALEELQCGIDLVPSQRNRRISDLGIATDNTRQRSLVSVPVGVVN